jgi:Flp pilus assembly protein TadB
MDGMDQAKFRCPRNLASSAELAAAWRPQLHVVGAIVHGHLEAYFVMDNDQPKDSNMNSTVLARVLDLIIQKFKALGLALPQSLIVATDNTAREGKNQFFIQRLPYGHWQVQRHGKRVYGHWTHA